MHIKVKNKQTVVSALDEVPTSVSSRKNSLAMNYRVSN
jgi:hypothetical protein